MPRIWKNQLSRRAGRNDFSLLPNIFSVGYIGRMVKPVEGFQHRGMIPVLGTASLGDAIEFTGGPGFDPRFGPERSNFFFPWGYTTPETPLCDRGAARCP